MGPLPVCSSPTKPPLKLVQFDTQLQTGETFHNEPAIAAKTKASNQINDETVFQDQSAVCLIRASHSHSHAMESLLRGSWAMTAEASLAGVSAGSTGLGRTVSHSWLSPLNASCSFTWMFLQLIDMQEVENTIYFHDNFNYKNDLYFELIYICVKILVLWDFVNKIHIDRCYTLYY